MKWKDWHDEDHPDGATWVHVDDLDCDTLVAEFLQMIRQDKLVPFPGTHA